jgi:dimethylhistidine N-methyltransferase
MINSGRARSAGAPNKRVAMVESRWAARRSVSTLEPASSDFLAETLAGLSRAPRTLPCKFFYDERGAELFQKISELPEYYVTRAELQILKEQRVEIASYLGEGIELIGLGTGAGTKTRILLEELPEPVAYIPVDISKEQLRQSTTLFHKLFPSLEILPVCTDYLQPFKLPTPKRKANRKVVYFPGSTIGNFEPREANDFLRRINRVCGENGGLLIGVDLRKDRQILEAAYNDRQGVTAQFNLNLLVRANRELGADFHPSHWKHRAIYNSDAGRIEMHLISETDQAVHIANHEFRFRGGEKIITEFSYKHTANGFTALAAQAGFRREHLWTDGAQLFGVFYFSVKL